MLVEFHVSYKNLLKPARLLSEPLAVPLPARVPAEVRRFRDCEGCAARLEQPLSVL